MQTRLFRFGALLFLFTFAAIGCGGANKPVKTDGIVTVEGTPAVGVTVEFIPEDEALPSANGITDDDGKFRLTTYSTGDGAVPGSYKVVVRQSIPEDEADQGKSDNPEGIKNMMKAHSGRMKKPGGKDSQKGLIHTRYSKESTTPLKQQIPADGTVELKLNKKGS